MGWFQHYACLRRPSWLNQIPYECLGVGAEQRKPFNDHKLIARQLGWFPGGKATVLAFKGRINRSSNRGRLT